MNYVVSPEANGDLFDIWRWIARDSLELADRVESELYDAFALIGATPSIGHSRRDLTRKPVLFFPVYSYLIIYDPTNSPVRMLAVLRGARNIRRILAGRLQSR